MTRHDTTEEGSVKFGLNQYGKPTPAGISKLFDFIALFLATVFIPSVTTAKFIPLIVSQYIVLTASILAGGFLLAKNFFGVQDTRKNIPAEDVTEMKP